MKLTLPVPEARCLIQWRLRFSAMAFLIGTSLLPAAAVPAEFARPAASMTRVRHKTVPPPGPLFAPKTYGAKGDGVTFDTQAIQKAIDACTGTGGSVVLRGGIFLSAPLTLKGKMTFYINRDATLLGSTNPGDYPKVFPEGEPAFANRRSLLYACRADGLVLDGAGTIDGQGQKLNMGGREPMRPSILRIFQSARVVVRNLSVRNPRMWTLVFSQCTNLDVDAVNVSAPRGYCPNLDGIDICDSNDVVVHNCVVNSEDDAICLKSHSPKVGLRHVLIENNSVLSYDANGLKIGTFTFGPIQDIVMRNNTVRGARLGGLCIESVDGSRLSHVTVEGLDINNVAEPIFIRLAHRPSLLVSDWQGMIENVTLDRVRVLAAKSRHGTGSTLSGIAAGRLRNIWIKNCVLMLPGGQTGPGKPVSVSDTGYPQSNVFGVTSGYAFYVQNADGVHFQNVICGFARADARPWLAFDNAADVTSEGCTDLRLISRPDKGNSLSGNRAP